MHIDLHCHSTHSDGGVPAAEVAERALATGVTLFSLTDHDTCAGHAATLSAFPNAVRGVELSCVEDDRSVHLLIYQRGGTSSWSVLEEACELQLQVRRTRVPLIAERLAAVGVNFDPDALLARTHGSVGRPHIADELVRIGAVQSSSEAFDRYLKDGGPGDVRVDRLSLGEGLEIGRAAGGCMSLAHPHLYGEGADSMLTRHRAGGLTGLEVYYSLYKAKKRKRWAALASKHDLVQTGGSDFHGERLAKVLRPGIEMPDPLAARLMEWLELPAVS